MENIYTLLNKMNKYKNNGMKDNVAIIGIKVENLEKIAEKHSTQLDYICTTLPKVTTRSKINTTLIIAIMVAIVGLAMNMIGG